MRYFYAPLTILTLCYTNAFALDDVEKKPVPRTLIAVADPWCPFNCDAESEYKGFMVDALKLALEPMGYTIDYQIVPWTRALAQTHDGTYDIVIAADREEGKGLLFPDYSFACGYSAFTLADRTFPYDANNVLETKRIGGILGYHYGVSESLLFRTSHSDPTRAMLLSGEQPLHRNIMKLKNGRIDVLYENEDVLNYTLRQYNYDISIKKIADTNATNCLYAVTPNKADSAYLIKLLTERLKTLDSTGEIQSIRRKYGI
jgi:polar amino acid transport system substrate-binding protein